MTIGIYKIENKKDGKSYIGQSINVEHRWKKYFRGDCKSQPKIYHAIKCHGIEAFTFDILQICKAEHLSAYEDVYIRYYKAIELGYNCRAYTSSGTTSEETRKKISDANKGRAPTMLGKTDSEATRKKMSDVRKGKRHSVEARKNMSDAGKKRMADGRGAHLLGLRKGQTFSEESRKKMSESNKGKTASDKTRKKMSDAHKERWALIRSKVPISDLPQSKEFDTDDGELNKQSFPVMVETDF